MGYTHIQSYNTQIKISGQDITLKRYDKNQVRGYIRKPSSSGKIKGYFDELKAFDKNEENCPAMVEAGRTSLVWEMVEEQFKNVKDDEEKTEAEKEQRFYKSLRRARDNIFDLIACNVGKWTTPNGKKQMAKFVTLTFKEDITDLAEANALFTAFIKNMNRVLFGSRQAILKYVCIPELQGKKGFARENNQVWHFHIVFFNMPFIPVNMDKAKELFALDKVQNLVNLADLWGNGFVFVNAIKDNSRVASYVTKYMTKGIIVKDGEITYKTEGDDDGLKNMSDYQNYKKHDLANMKRFQTSKGLHKAFKIHLVMNNEVYIETMKMLKQKQYLLDLDKQHKKINTYGVTNKHRGVISVSNFRMRKKHLNSYVDMLYRIKNINRNQQQIRITDHAIKIMNYYLWNDIRNKYTEGRYAKIEQEKANYYNWLKKRC